MKIHNLSEQNSILNNYLLEIRDVNIQNDSMRFRRNIERIGELMAYEISKELEYKSIRSHSPLEEFQTKIVSDNIVLCSILRAGLPFHNGLLNIFDASENAFVSAYRHHLDSKGNFEIKVEYLACPSLDDKILILADPMLATGKSIVAVLEALSNHGKPKRVFLMSIIGSQNGVGFLSKRLNPETELWIASIDKGLSQRGYILPGLGDAGDLSFGTKLQN